MSFGITEPLEAVGQQRNGGITHRESLHRPAVVADHDLVQRESLFLAPNEEVAKDLRDAEHDASLPQKPGVSGGIVHDPGAPGCGQRQAGKSSSHNETKITELHIWGDFYLFFALLVLSKRRPINQKTGTGAYGEVRPVIFIPMHEIPPR